MDGEKKEFVDYPAIAKAYAQACVAGTNAVNRYVMLACKRYLRMLDLAEDPKSGFFFSPAHVVDYCDFVEKLRHFQDGNWLFTQKDADGNPDPRIILEPWQIWVESAIQGFRRRLVGTRLVETAVEVVPRKNAKSLRAVPAALFDLCCSGGLAPEVTVAAASARQADDTLFGHLLKMVAREPELVEQYRLSVTNDEIRCGEGRIFRLTGQGEKNDGLNPSLALFEEGHAGAASVYNVVKSAFGARPNALLRMITTAGYRPEGPGWDLQLQGQMILDGGTEDYTFFAAIYALDKEDYLDEENQSIRWDRLLGPNAEVLLAKVNPMYRISLDPLKVRSALNEALRTPNKRGEVARTRYNIWTGAGTTLIEPSAWTACRGKIKLEQFLGAKCWIGVDLAQRLDMCAIVLVFELPEDKLAVFAKFFLPDASPTTTDPDMHDQYAAWAEGDDPPLVLTEGPLADHDRIAEELEVYCDVFDVQMIAFDPHQAHTLVSRLWKANKPVMTFKNSAFNMTPPTDDLISRVTAKTIVHDGNPVLAWHMGNVHGEKRPNGSIMPRKEDQNSKRKIDGAVAFCFANGVRMMPFETEAPKGEKPRVSDPYLTRGLINAEVRANG